MLSTSPAALTHERPVLRDAGWSAEHYRDAYEMIRSSPAAVVQLTGVREGVTLTKIEGVSVYLVRHGDIVRALLAQSPYDGARMPYCRTSGWFESTTHGDKYDESGRPANKLAPRGMASIPTRVERGAVIIDLAGLAAGPLAVDAVPAAPASGPLCVH